MSDLWRFNLLGNLAIEENGRTSPIIKSDRSCALLAYLLVTKQTHNREQLADLFWESQDTAQSMARLRTILSRTKKLVPALTVTRKQVSLTLAPDAFVDLYAVEDGLFSEEIDQLDATLQLYRGELLHGFYLPDAPRFNEWLVLQREQIRQKVVQAYGRLADLCATQERWRVGIAAAQRWLLLDDLDERVYRWLMIFLAADGQVGQALAQYERCCQLLLDELGVEADEETVALAQRLESLTEPSLLEKVSLVQTWTAGELSAPGALPSNAFVPYRRNADFVGREVALVQIAEQLLLPQPEGNKTPPVVAITGMGGLGKSQLAVEFAYRYGRYFAGGVYWMSFANPDNVAEEVAVIGSERGMRLYKDADKLTLTDRVQRVQRIWQEATPRLLIFDNCESETLLTEWLPVTGGCSVLLTSQRAIWDRQFHVHTQPLTTLSTTESVSLLQKMVPRLTAEDAQRIAAEVGHLPLALHLAGSFLARYIRVSADRYLQELKKKSTVAHASLKGLGSSPSPTGHELDVARTFALNWDQLNTQNPIDQMARHLMMAAACFAPGEPIPQTWLLHAFLEDDADFEAELLVEDGLFRLIDLGFLERSTQNSVIMHRLLSAFTQARSSDVIEARTTVENYSLKQIRIYWEEHLNLQWLPITAVHLHHLTDTALVRTDVTAAMLANFWGRYLLDNLQFDQAKIYLEQALTIRESLSIDDDFDLASILTNVGSLLWRKGKDAEAWPYFCRATEITKQLFGSEHSKTALSLNSLGVIQSRLGNFEQALSYYGQAVVIFEKHEDTQTSFMITLRNMGILYRRLGEYEQARHCYQRVFAVTDEVKDKKPVQWLGTLNSLAYVENKSGNYETARQLLEEALLIYQQSFAEGQLNMTFPLMNLATVQTVLAQYADAERCIQQAMTLRQKGIPPNHPYIGVTYIIWGNLRLQQGDYAGAKRDLQTAVSILETASTSSQPDLVEALTHLGELYIALGELEEAHPYLHRALTLAEQVLPATHPDLATPLISMGQWHDANGEPEVAQELYGRAYTILKDKVAPTQIDWQRLRPLLTINPTPIQT